MKKKTIKKYEICRAVQNNPNATALEIQALLKKQGVDISEGYIFDIKRQYKKLKQAEARQYQQNKLDKELKQFDAFLEGKPIVTGVETSEKLDELLEHIRILRCQTQFLFNERKIEPDEDTAIERIKTAVANCATKDDLIEVFQKSKPKTIWQKFMG